MKKKKLAFLSLALAAVLGLSACGGGTTTSDDGDEAVTLRIAWWGGQPRHESTLSVIDMYKAENPNVNIEPEYTDWSGYWDKLGSQMAAKNLPDIIQQDYAYLGQWMEKKQLADLTEFVNDKTLDLSDVGENFIGGNLNGGIYGVSLGTNALSFIYNPDAYTAAGLSLPDENYTWDQYMSDAVALKKAGYGAMLLLNKDPKFFVEQIVREAGKTFYSEDGTSLGFDDSKLVEKALQLQSDLITNGLSVDKDVAYSIQNIEESLLLKKVSWGELSWSNNFVPVAKLCEEANFEININVPPRTTGAEKSGVYIKPSMLFSVAATSENQKAAAKFISYFINDIEANKVLGGERGVPVSSVVRETIKDSLSKPDQKVYDYIDVVNTVGTPIDNPEPSGSGEVSSTLSTIFQEIVYGTKTPADGASEFMTKANEILAKNK